MSGNRSERRRQQANPGDSATRGAVVGAVIHPGDALPESEYRLFVPVLESIADRDVERLIRTGEMLVAPRNGTILLGCLAVFPRQTPLDAVTEDDEPVANVRERLEELLSVTSSSHVSVSGLVALAHQEWRSIVNVAETHDCDGVLMMIDPDTSKRGRLLTGSTVERVTEQAECDVFVEKLHRRDAPVRSILLAVSSGPHSGLAAETARVVAEAVGARVEAVHYLGDDADESDREAGERVIQATRRVFDGLDDVEVTLHETADVAEAIVARSNEFDLTVLGAPTSGLLRQLAFGSVVQTVEAETENAVLMVKRNVGARSAFDRWVAGDSID